ncbi:MAG: DUF4386 domain-containing protein [Balneolaceae bacterium]
MSNKVNARWAGFFYFLLVIGGIFSLMYVPSNIIVWEDTTATLSNLTTHNSLFRLGIVAELLSYLVFIMVPLLIYRLLHHVHEVHAKLMVILVLVSIPISMIAVGYKLNILDLLDDASTFTAVDLEISVMNAFDAYYNLILVAQLFWGLWLLPFGYLVYQSGILPKVLGFFLMLGSVGYFLDVLFRILFLDYNSWIIADYITIPASIGELGTCLWLLIMGAKEPIE